MIYFILDNEEILFYLQNKSKDEYINKVLPNLKSFYSNKLNIDINELESIKESYYEENRIHKNNRNIEILKNICNSIKNKEDFNISELDDIIRGYLFYKVWENKGKICGVHNDFGRISFMRINEIDSKYFCTDEERINCCKDLCPLLSTSITALFTCPSCFLWSLSISSRISSVIYNK